MEKLTLTKISYTDKKADGSQCVTVNGKPFYRVGLKAQQYGDRWINGLVFGDPPAWREGQEVQLEIKEEDYQGTKNLKFEIPKVPAQSGEIEKLWLFVRGLEQEIKGIKYNSGSQKSLETTTESQDGPPISPNDEFQGSF